MQKSVGTIPAIGVLGEIVLAGPVDAILGQLTVAYPDLKPRVMGTANISDNGNRRVGHPTLGREFAGVMFNFKCITETGPLGEANGLEIGHVVEMVRETRGLLIEMPGAEVGNPAKFDMDGTFNVDGDYELLGSRVERVDGDNCIISLNGTPFKISGLAAQSIDATDSEQITE